MVHDLVVAAELRVLVLQHVEAVRALRDDLLHAHAVERLDVLHGEHLEDVLVARAAGLVAVAQLARAEDREVDARRAAAAWRARGSSSCCGRRSCPRSRRSRGTRGRTAPPGSTISTPSSCSAQSPRSPWFMPYALPGVLHRAVRVAELGREVALHQREVAPHVEDLVEDLDVDRADLVARLAATCTPTAPRT